MYKHKSKITRVSRPVDFNRTKAEVKAGHLCAVDQFGVQDFGRNDSGWPRNTISMLARCQTMEQYKMIAQRLVEQPVKSDPNSRLSIADQFALVRPRYAQTPSECEALALQLAQMDMSKINDAYDKAVDKAVKVETAKAQRAARAAAAASTTVSAPAGSE